MFVSRVHNRPSVRLKVCKYKCTRTSRRYVHCLYSYLGGTSFAWLRSGSSQFVHWYEYAKYDDRVSSIRP